MAYRPMPPVGTVGNVGVSINVDGVRNVEDNILSPEALENFRQQMDRIEPLGHFDSGAGYVGGDHQSSQRSEISIQMENDVRNGSLGLRDAVGRLEALREELFDSSLITVTYEGGFGPPTDELLAKIESGEISKAHISMRNPSGHDINLSVVNGEVGFFTDGYEDNIPKSVMDDAVDFATSEHQDTIVVPYTHTNFTGTDVAGYAYLDHDGKVLATAEQDPSGEWVRNEVDVHSINGLIADTAGPVSSDPEMSLIEQAQATLNETLNNLEAGALSQEQMAAIGAVVGTLAENIDLTSPILCQNVLFDCDQMLRQAGLGDIIPQLGLSLADGAPSVGMPPALDAVSSDAVASGMTMIEQARATITQTLNSPDLAALSTEQVGTIGRVLFEISDNIDVADLLANQRVLFECDQMLREAGLGDIIPQLSASIDPASRLEIPPTFQDGVQDAFDAFVSGVNDLDIDLTDGQQQVIAAANVSLYDLTQTVDLDPTEVFDRLVSVQQDLVQAQLGDLVRGEVIDGCWDLLNADPIALETPIHQLPDSGDAVPIVGDNVLDGVILSDALNDVLNGGVTVDQPNCHAGGEEDPLAPTIIEPSVVDENAVLTIHAVDQDLPEVRELQEKLNELAGLDESANIDLGAYGELGNGVDGHFGSMTEASVMAVQAAMYPDDPERVTGFADNDFMEALDARITELNYQATLGQSNSGPTVGQPTLG